MQKQKLTSVHTALQRAQLASQSHMNLATASFKVQPLKKELVMSICERHGTDMSEFIRQCFDGLIADYMGEKEYARVEALGLATRQG